MKMNCKGQALIEFVIILPVLIMLIFGFIDLGRIILENNKLENLTTNVINRYEKNKIFYLYEKNEDKPRSFSSIFFFVFITFLIVFK